ncbi:glycoside hydrolase family 32 protein [Anaerococcus urinomassiliensis]|uniref:glycoside hydrolase family 32 protein n=1 Tax=Anaerococcus urinomassiliensis TaxID=1745712 RepID=UPI000939CF8A|nr:glycoside hydrolase family 32 protein [Anaerococcus urinomassiliensis]
MSFSTGRSNDFIKNNKDRVDDKFYPIINFAAPVGWINDPNGVSVVGDEYHLFYQYYPYEPVHGPMHWGHAKTKDGKTWEHLPVALAPDQSYDKNGVFSGSAIEKDGKLYLMYTGHLTETDHGEVRQNQNIAVSDDNINFDKYQANPVLDENNLPENISKKDFRDPKVFKKDNKYYAVIGTKTEDEVGTVLLYESDDLLTWSYKSVLISDEKYLGDMPECPDLLLFDDNKAALLVSAMNFDYEGMKHPHKTMIIEGHMNWDTYKFIPESIREMDYGFDYYAPQSAKEGDDYFIIAWNQSWGTNLIPGESNHNWMGQMTVPQLVYEKDGEIKRSIHPKVLENKNLLEKTTNKANESLDINPGNYIYIKYNKKNSSYLKLEFKNKEESFSFKFDLENNKGSFNRESLAYPIKSDRNLDIGKKEFAIRFEEENDIGIIFDKSSIQIYINDKYSISNTYYSENPLDTLIIDSDNGKSLELIENYSLLGEN